MLTIHETTLPETHTDPDWVQTCALIRAYDHELIGGPQWDVDDESLLASTKAERNHKRRRFLAMLDGVAVGYANLRIHLLDSPDAANLLVYVLPEYRRRGIGERLAQTLAAAVTEERVQRVTAWITTPPAAGEKLVPSSSVGAVPADHDGVRMALRHGLRLCQAERVSRYDFDAPLIDPDVALADAKGVAGEDYEVITWEGAAPDDLTHDLAVLKQRMSTDVPSGERVVHETQWDAERVRRTDSEILVSNRLHRAVVRHKPSGVVVALNELVRDRSNPVAFVDQWDTIVLPEHRGRRLGMLVKAVNLLALRRADPGATAVVTWNAEENRHMLAVNEALGFHEILVEGAFERAL